MRSDEQFLEEIKAKRDAAVRKRARTVKTVTGISSAVALCAVICFAAIPALMIRNEKTAQDSAGIKEEPQSKQTESDGNNYNYGITSESDEPLDSSDAEGHYEGEKKAGAKPLMLFCGYKVALPDGYYVGAEGMSIYSDEGIRIVEKCESGPYELGGVFFDVTDEKYKDIADGIFASAVK